MRKLLLFFSFLFILLNILIWFFVFFEPRGKLTVSFLDVGQGDAIYIESPTGVEVLIDGGKDRSVLRELSKRMGPLDRSIDLVIETHPDADHIGGLPGVFAMYRVGAFMQPDIPVDTPQADALTASVAKERGAESLTAERGTRLLLGGGAYADILFPDRAVPWVETNTGSVVVRVVYGTTSFLLTGDAPDEIEEWMVALADDGELRSTVLKAGHHGSRTSTSPVFLAAVDPEFVVISAGRDNSYGHPHQEVLNRISTSGATILKTMGEGAVTFVSDGAVLKQK